MPDLQFVAEVTQRIEDDPLLPERAGKNVVDLVEQKDLDVHGAHVRIPVILNGQSVRS
jgi:hypothetical protein